MILLKATNLSWVVKISVIVIVICVIRNTIYYAPKSLVFVAFRGTLKPIGIIYAKRSWGDVKTIKSGKRSDLGSDISKKQSILYTSPYT